MTTPQAGPSAPQGFFERVAVAPRKMSPKLAAFMDVEPDTPCKLNVVLSYITKYIREHNLQNPNNRREIIPDECLQNLLCVPEGENLYYFTLTKYIMKTFV